MIVSPSTDLILPNLGVSGKPGAVQTLRPKAPDTARPDQRNPADLLTSPMEWSRRNLSSPLAVGPAGAWPAELAGVAQPAARWEQGR